MSSASAVDPNLESLGGRGVRPHSEEHHEWIMDGDFDELDVNPLDPTDAKPGSEDKVMMLAARYAAGLPLWHGNDCYDHGPDDEPLDEE